MRTKLLDTPPPPYQIFPTAVLREQGTFNTVFLSIRVFFRKHKLFLFAQISESFQKNTQNFRKGLSCEIRKHQNKKQFRLNKRIGDAHKAGDRHTKLSQHFHASRRGVRNIIKKFKESLTV